MNKKQICKISYDDFFGRTANNIYGICLYGNVFLLETGKLIDIATKRLDTQPIMKDDNILENIKQTLDSSRADIIRLNDRWTSLKSVTVNNTRNVPGKIRETLEETYDIVSRMIKIQNKFKEIENDYIEEMCKLNKLTRGMPEKIRAERGTLSKDEFVKVFYDSLSDEVKYAMNNSKVRGYNGLDGEYAVEMYSQNIEINREVWIDKWASPSYSYMEYDDTTHIDRDQDPKAYDRDLKKYSRPLPVKDKIKEYLSLGDKKSLEYHGSYTIAVDPKKELTKEYAIQLADKFCGTSKTRKADKEEDIAEASADTDIEEEENEEDRSC